MTRKYLVVIINSDYSYSAYTFTNLDYAKEVVNDAKTRKGIENAFIITDSLSIMKN